MKKLCFAFFLLYQYAILFAQHDGYIKQAGETLHFRTYGSGKPLLLINGGPGMNSEGFEALATLLADNNKVIIYDQRGTGKSHLEKVDTQTITMDLMVKDIEHLRNHLKIEKWVILGHSFGGMLACYYATIHPQHLEALILSSSGGVDLELLDYVSQAINSKLTPGQLDSLNYYTNNISAGDTSYYTRLQRAKILAVAYVYRQEHLPVVAKRLTQTNHQVNNLVWQNLRKIKFNCAPQLSNFNEPVLIIQGKQDIIAIRTAVKAKQTLKKSELVLMDNCIHYGWLDSREEYLSHIKKFLANLM